MAWFGYLHPQDFLSLSIPLSVCLSLSISHTHPTTQILTVPINHSFAIKIWEQLFFTALALKNTINYFIVCGVEPVSVSLESILHWKKYLQLRGAQCRVSSGEQCIAVVRWSLKWDFKAGPAWVWLPYRKNGPYRSGLAGTVVPRGPRFQVEGGPCDFGVYQLFCLERAWEVSQVILEIIIRGKDIFEH